MPKGPASLSCRGGPLVASCAVAIVGSRLADPDAEGFARTLAAAVARSGAVVVSGGALGIDAAAHRGALEVGGRTWAVAGTGCEHCFPAEHAALFEAIGAGPGTMVWPFRPSVGVLPGSFIARNRVLVALADVVVVVQAGMPSGALRAAACATDMGKPLWVVPAPPWAPLFRGSHYLLDRGAKPLTSVEGFLDALGLTGGTSNDAERTPQLDLDLRLKHGTNANGYEKLYLDEHKFSVEEIRILRAVATAPLHVDEIAALTALTVHRVTSTLLTLALENVVVEGPSGFFRRHTS